TRWDSVELNPHHAVGKSVRYGFDKFPVADESLWSHMKSFGDAMGSGRTFTEAFLKSARSREGDSESAELPPGAHPWFTEQLEEARAALARVRSLDDLVADDWIALKRAGWSDSDVAAAANASEEAARSKRLAS